MQFHEWILPHEKISEDGNEEGERKKEGEREGRYVRYGKRKRKANTVE